MFQLSQSLKHPLAAPLTAVPLPRLQDIPNPAVPAWQRETACTLDFLDFSAACTYPSLF